MPRRAGVIKEVLGEMKTDATEMDMSSGCCIVKRRDGVVLIILATHKRKSLYLTKYIHSPVALPSKQTKEKQITPRHTHSHLPVPVATQYSLPQLHSEGELFRPNEGMR